MSIQRPQSAKIRKTLTKLPLFATLLLLFVGGITFAPNSQASAHESEEDVFEIQSIVLQTEYDLLHTHSGEVLPPKSVTVRTVDGEVLVLTYALNVEGVLTELGYPPDEDDKTTPGLDHMIIDGLLITLTTVDSVFEFKEESVPFKTEYVDSSTLKPGETQLQQKGVNGILKHTYLLTYEDGRLINNELLDSVVTKAPVTQIYQRGRRQVGTFDCPKWDQVIDNTTSNKTERFWMKSVMRCESACNSSIVSKSGAFHGLFQFTSRTFYVARGGNDIYDGHEQIKYTLLMFRAGAAPKDQKAGAWPVCNANAWAKMPNY